MEKYKITDKGYKNLLFELVRLDNKFNSTVSKIEATEDVIEILDLERETELIFDRQKEIYEIVNNSTLLDKEKRVGLNVKDMDIDFTRFIGEFNSKDEAKDKVIEIYKKRGNIPVVYEIYELESEN